MEHEISLYIPTGVKAQNEDQNNQSVVDQIGNIVRFGRSQQIYPYRMLDEWGEGMKLY